MSRQALESHRHFTTSRGEGGRECLCGATRDPGFGVRAWSVLVLFEHALDFLAIPVHRVSFHMLVGA